MLLEILTKLSFFRMMYAAGKKMKKEERDHHRTSECGMRFIMISLKKRKRKRRKEKREQLNDVQSASKRQTQRKRRRGIKHLEIHRFRVWSERGCVVSSIFPSPSTYSVSTKLSATRASEKAHSPLFHRS